MEEKKEMKVISPTDPNFINPGAPNLIKLYANGFTVGPTMSDMYMIGVLNNSPSFVVNMSFNTAKTLHKALTKLISDFEKTTKEEIKGINEIQESFKNEGQSPENQ
jgi:hypothetical protein